MSKLTSILTEVLKKIDEDAGAEKDISQAKLSDEYIKYIDKQIESYSSNSNVIRKIEDGEFDAVEINFDNLTVQISQNISPNVHDADFVPSKGKKPALIKINKATIKIKPKLVVKYDENSLKHELKHYYDSLDDTDEFRNNLNKQFKINNRKGGVKDPDEYWNNPNEVNAYFFEHFMPDVLKYLKKEKELPESFQEFTRELFQNSASVSFYKKLNEENRKKIVNRLEVYYKDILSNPSFKIEDDDNKIDNSRLEKATYGFLKKLKDKLGLFEGK